MLSIWGMVIWVAVFMLIHAGFSAVHYKELATIAAIELESDFVPLDVKLEAFVAVLIALFGAVMDAGKLQPIDGSSMLNKMSWAEFWDDPNFRVYNHRAKFLRERIK